jgi:D-inositol-3-phosphate glycosyltransferase
MGRRIALISEHASPLAVIGGVDSGGQNVYVGQLARHLSGLGYDVDVFTRRDGEGLPREAEWLDGVRIVNVPAGPARPVPKEELLPYMDDFANAMVRICKRRRYEIAHANFWMSGAVAVRLKREIGLPFVVTFHALGKVRRRYQGDADRFPDERFAIEEEVVREADAIIAECPQDEEDLIRLYDADPERVTIIPAGFDPREFSPMSKELARAALGLPPRERIVLHVGRMVPRKGVDNVVHGFARMRDRFPVPARLVIVGGETDGPDPAATPEIGRLAAIAEEEKVSERVTFTGRVARERLRYFFSAADVFVTTPWYEPFGITPLEAMACGTPVIGSNVGGIRFTVRDGETGYLVPPDDPDALADRLTHLLGHPNVATVLRSHAIARANDLFTWRHVGSSVAALYERLLTAVHDDSSYDRGELRTIETAFDESVEVLERSRRLLRRPVLEAAEAMAACFQAGGKVLVAGNGGSAAQAQHLAAELVGRFRRQDRPALPVISLATDTSVMTAWANDVDFDSVFARQVAALGRAGDLFIGISTSGWSRNLVQALEAARRAGLRSLAIVGGDGGPVRKLADHVVLVPSASTQRVQEVHLMVLHTLCELVENRVAGPQWPALAAVEDIAPDAGSTSAVIAN